MLCQIRIIKEAVGLFPKYQPKVGSIYNAELCPQHTKNKDGTWGSGNKEFCVVNVMDKKIILRQGEYEIVWCCDEVEEKPTKIAKVKKPKKPKKEKKPNKEKKPQEVVMFCLHCGKELVNKRKSAKYCDVLCKRMAFYYRHLE